MSADMSWVTQKPNGKVATYYRYSEGGARFNNGERRYYKFSFDSGRYGDGYKVENRSGKKHFIPTKYSREWNSLKAHPPRGIHVLSIRDGRWSRWYFVSEKCDRFNPPGVSKIVYGYKRFVRYCNNPYPLNGGRYCSGSSVETDRIICCKPSITYKKMPSGRYYRVINDCTEG